MTHKKELQLSLWVNLERDTRIDMPTSKQTADYKGPTVSSGLRVV